VAIGYAAQERVGRVISTLVTGYGYWGQIITERLLAHPDYFVTGIHDPNLEARRFAQARNLHTYRTLEDAINRESPELVCVCTPASVAAEASVYSSTRYAHVLAAKPAATTRQGAERMINAAARRDRKLVVDYTVTAAPKWQRIKQLLPTLGEIRRVDCVRTTPLGRSSVDVLEDLAPHDLSLIVDAMPSAEWRVTSSRGDAGSRELHLAAEECAAVVVVRRGGEPERMIRFVGVDGALTWDQSRDSLICATSSSTVVLGADAVDSVTARLWLLARVIRGGEDDNRRVFRQVSSLVEDARESEVADAA
jgi:predicted dehydrogenase